MLKNKKKLKIVSIVLVLATTVGIFAGTSMNANAEVLLEESNPQFEHFVNYTGDPMDNGSWYPDPEICKLTYDEESTNYTFTSNAFAMWGREDNVSYAYNKYRLNNGDLGKMKITAKILEHSTADPAKVSEMHENASIGICIRGTSERSGIYDSSKDAQEIYLHCRAGQVMLVYRTKDGNVSGRSSYMPNITAWPVYLTMEKEGNGIKCSVKMGDDGITQSFPTVFVSFPEIVTVGMAAHSVNEDVPITSVFTDYNLTIEGPAGTTYEPVVDGSTGDTGEEDENLDDVIPNDPPLTEGILFRETFTDGSLVNESADDMEHADNPIWSNEYSIDGAAEMAKIVTDEDNRYWHRPFSADTYIFPNLEWSDYSMEADLKFGPDTSLEQTNEVNLYVRVNAARATGFYGYRVTMKNNYNASTGAGIQTVAIYKICGVKDLESTKYPCITVNYDYIVDEWKTWRVEAFDNRISVYCEEEAVVEFIEERGSEIGAYAVNGLGGIGFGSSTADLMVDNIVVREMEDLLGGNYDNSISGRWDKAIPDYILNYAYEIE